MSGENLSRSAGAGPPGNLQRGLRAVELVYISSRTPARVRRICLFFLSRRPRRGLCTGEPRSGRLPAIARRIEGSDMQTGIFLASARRGTSHPRHLLIVSRQYRGLYEYVRARFADEDNVEVVLDRRRGRDRRTMPGRPTVDRRAAERRAHSHVDAALRLESMQFVTIAPRSSEGPEGEVTTG